MKIAVLKERYTNETRVAITPDTVKLFIKYVSRTTLGWLVVLVMKNI